MKNPIYVEYYSHLNSKCYKIDIPWANYRKHTLVLCTLKEGIKKAKKLAKYYMCKELNHALTEPIKQINTFNHNAEVIVEL
jgi:hypothetical protein